MNNKKNILFFIFLICYSSANSQIIGSNLVQNPSFEEYIQCPWSSGQLNYANNWFGFGTEYYNACDSTINHSVPYNWAGYQKARNGVAYAGLHVYWGPPTSEHPLPYQESIKNILKNSLVKNKRYCVDYYISLAEITVVVAALHNNNIVFFDSLGTMFSDTVLQDVDYTTACDNYVKFSKSLVGIDTLNWFRISGSVIANGGEKYLRIGKFYDVIWPPNTKAEFYVYVDDVSVCECKYEHLLGNDTTLCNGTNLVLKPRNFPNTHINYTWQDGSTNTTYEVKDSGTYWVRAYVEEYDITSTDTIHITYKDCEIINPAVYIPNCFTPDDDGLNDVFSIKTTIEFSSFNIKIYNRWAQQVFESNDANFGWNGIFKGSPVPTGVYIYYIEATEKLSKKSTTFKGRITVLY
jgi:gliding motility-associated-like protein